MRTFIPNKTLVIRLSSIGDIILTSPFIRCFRKAFPETTIEYAVKREFVSLVRFNPHIDRLHEFDAREGFDGLKNFKRTLAGERYDLVVDLHDSLRSRYLRRLQGNPAVAVIRKRKLLRFLLIRFKLNVYKRVVPVTKRYIESVEAFGVADDFSGPELFIPAEVLRDIAGQMAKIRPHGTTLIAFCPSAKHFTKRWPKDYFVAMARHLGGSGNVRIVLLGGAEDASYVEDIRRLIGGDTAVNLAGKLTLLESAAVMDHCELVISNDTGLMHMAAARKRNLIALFGPTVKEFGFFPHGESSHVLEHPDMPCRPCSHIGSNTCPKGHFKCMKEITPERVLRYINEKFKSIPVH